MSRPDAAILVVDDNDDNRYALCRRLEREGYRGMETAANGREALERLAARPFDLVLLDIQMPELDGYEVLARMKADPVLRHVPVIMISAVSELDSVVRCIELGADDYLPKPFNGVILRARIGACLERKRLHDREAAHLEEIERQRVRADRLLHAILPAPAVAELEATERVQPRRYDGVAVLFADIVGFTAYCEARPPETVVENLQLLVEAFEDLSARHGMEKIKTVGDALMATANLVESHEDPVMAAVRLGFDLIEAARRNPAQWDLRVAIHFGSVVAGIVGRSKFSFDLWGDTVNTAARLASFGDAAIHLSDAAWARVADRCRARRLGPVAVKGKGAVEVYRCEVACG
jgi:class 3 adenylate cyclase/CheY-like chemotaxis protein